MQTNELLNSYDLGVHNWDEMYTHQTLRPQYQGLVDFLQQMSVEELNKKEELAKRLYDRFGPQRLMWGTDWPIAKERATYAQRLTVVRDAMGFLSSDDKRWILSKSVAEVWPGLNSRRRVDY